jgi:hypothetical protein
VKWAEVDEDLEWEGNIQLAVTVGSHSWQSQLAVTVGSRSWQSQLAVAVGSRSWQSQFSVCSFQ